MREILFRGKDAIDGKWIYGDVVHRHRYNDYVGIDRYVGGQFGYAIAQVKNESVSQYTGLTDKNGLAKIFEGDIVRLQNLKRLYEVYWDKKEARYKARNGGCVSPLCNAYNVFVEEVVGNVYDNPELLKG